MSGDPSPSPFAPPSSTPSRPRSHSRQRRASQGASATPSRPSSSAVPATPALPNPQTTAALLAQTGASPHYTTSLRSRHSLYGTEDRVVLDLGSRVWKAGFSGETAPRECRSVLKATDGDGLWGLDQREPDEDEWKVRKERLKRLLRDIWFSNLMVDPKTRKVIVLENPLLPTSVKDMIARVLFDNLQVPSVSFASAPLLSLMAAGTVTGLVVDVGHLETTVLPVFHSRPLFPLLTSTPRASSSRLNRRLRSLLLLYASYVPPPASLTSVAATASQAGRVPREVLSEELVEWVKGKACFVGEELEEESKGEDGGEGRRREGRTMSLDAPPTPTSSTSSTPPTPSFSAEDLALDPDLPLLSHLVSRYSSPSPIASATPTTTLSFAIPNLSLPPPAAGTGRGWLLVPGWVRERAAEVLWEEGDGDELGLAEVVCEGLLKLPTDLRRPLASSILLTGGTPMLPGFFPRFKASLLSLLARSKPPPYTPPTPPASSSSASSSSDTETPTATAETDTTPHRTRRRLLLSSRLHTLRHSPRHAPLVPLAPHLAILNHPSPHSLPSSSSSTSFPAALASSAARAAEGSAPAWSPALQSWIGGSLAGALKTAGTGEVTREMLDESGTEGSGRRRRGGGEDAEEEEGEEEEQGEAGGRRERVPDWSAAGAWTRVA